jgi:hypothetical protein
LDDWLMALRLLARRGQPYALLWEDIVLRERTMGDRLVRLSAMRSWLLGVQQSDTVVPPPSHEDRSARYMYSVIFGEH